MAERPAFLARKEKQPQVPRLPAVARDDRAIYAERSPGRRLSGPRQGAVIKILELRADDARVVLAMDLRERSR